MGQELRVGNDGKAYINTHIEYTEATGVLRLTTNKGTPEEKVHDTNIPIGGVIDENRTSYDPLTHILTITFIKSDGSEFQVQIDMASLVEDWEVKNNPAD
jgi:hypothetical protein